MSQEMFTFIAMLVIVTNVLLIITVVYENKRFSGLLTGCFAAATIVTLSYTISIWSSTYLMNSIFCSLYFAGLSCLLFYLLLYTVKLTEPKKNKVKKTMLRLIALWNIIDVICMAINPFYEFVISYHYDPKSPVVWHYDGHLFYQLHLLYSYLVVVIVIVLLIKKMSRCPRVYRQRYSLVASGILIVVMLNAVFLVNQGENALDYSLFLYSIMCGLIFWLNNHYSGRGMLMEARAMVLDELNHPMVLFDYENNFIMSNKSADFLARKRNPKLEYTLWRFIEDCAFGPSLPDTEHNYSFQWKTLVGEEARIFRCDFSVLRDKKGRAIGRLFLFTDDSLEHDLTTGFYTETRFKRDFKHLPEQCEYPVGVVICDINRLSNLNEKQGKEAGDRAIQMLAETIRACTPEGTYYTRLNDANLVFICGGTSLLVMREYVKNLEERLTKKVELGEPICIQSAVSMATTAEPDVVAAVNAALRSMRAKKMMDAGSNHSSLLDSLAQTLQEADSCTMEHVRRTQIMGEKLGIRLGLSDVDLSNLALLCLLHDIGKLGVPLEILNKPGKLTKEEWEVMSSHAEKGYRIAKASKELEEIAELILHHHECWNGKGYPDHLEKEAIPLLSRIIAVVDTYDAMTNDRPYRQALTNGQACKELTRCAGTQFDPYIIGEFLDLLRESGLYEDDEKLEESGKQEKAIIKPMGLVEDIPGSMEVFAVPYSKYVIDKEYNIIEVDDNFEQLTGYSREDIKEYKLRQNNLILAEDNDEYMRMVVKMLTDDHEAFVEHRIRRKDGTTRYVYCDGREYFDSVTRAPRIRIIVTDISMSNSVQRIVTRERGSARRNQRMWEESIRKDPLTGLLNRIAFQNDVQMSLIEEEHQLVMMMLDVDVFKRYNDTKGHKMGDELLITIGHALQDAIRKNGICSRMGGDEFAVLLRFDKELSREELKECLHSTWEKIMTDISAFEKQVTISMGIAVATSKTDNFNKLYRLADHALYEAKTKGRAQYVLNLEGIE